MYEKEIYKNETKEKRKKTKEKVERQRNRIYRGRIKNETKGEAENGEGVRETERER
jgi:hypothetical protein